MDVISYAKEKYDSADILANLFTLQIEWVSERVAKGLGYDSSDELRGVPILKLATLDRHQLMELITQAVSRKDMVDGKALYKKDGSVVRTTVVLHQFAYEGEPYVVAENLKFLDAEEVLAPQFVWVEEMSLGNEQLDAQHKDIIAATNAFALKLHDGCSNEDALRYLEKVKDYIKNHLAYEEAIWDKYNYPATEEHVRGHNVLINKYEEFTKRLANSEDCKTVAREARQFIFDFLQRHLITERKSNQAFWSEIARLEREV